MSRLRFDNCLIKEMMMMMMMMMMMAINCTGNELNKACNKKPK